MVLSIVSKLCWAIRHITLAILNPSNEIILQNDNSAWLLQHFVLIVVVLLPLFACICWCFLALEEWILEEDERGYFRRMLVEAEEARLRELDERERKKKG